MNKEQFKAKIRELLNQKSLKALSEKGKKNGS